MTAPVAVLGLGVMGRGIAERLADRGYRVRVWNRTPGRAPVGHPSIEECASPAQAATGCSHILLALADDAALEKVLSEAASGLAPGQVVLNLGTVRADTVRRLAAGLGTGVVLLDAGMLGNATHARQGELRFYVAGSEAAMDLVRPVLDQVGKEVTHVGPLGAGMDLKLALNLLMGLEMQALAEVIALAEGLGIARATVLDTVRGSGFAAPVMGFKAMRMAARRYGDPDFRLALMAKDLGLAVDAAAASGRRLPMASAAHRTHVDARDAGWGDRDCAAIADALGGGTAS